MQELVDETKKVNSAEEFKEAFREALESNEPYLLDVPMENIPVPTEGIWNINDIYTPKENVKDGVFIIRRSNKKIKTCQQNNI